ncbi:MAG: hypothetical protein AYK19_19185 [Theionarchaea archaeon DG-70-1]|nr:MAG: hypothetical protein AYK19_19185 [Theionarchaea archaeon DG-70-1]
MRKMVVFAVAAVLLASSASIVRGKDIKVLVDESRLYEIDPLIQDFLINTIDLPDFFWDVYDWGYSFNNIFEPWGFAFAKLELEQVATVFIKKEGELSYSTLREYDILVIASFEEDYTSEEMDAIRKFVENGGGLLLLGDFEYPNNSIAQAFDVLFYSETAVIADNKAVTFAGDNHQFYVIDIEEHPITKGVDRIALNFGIPLSSYESGKVLARTSGSSWADKDGLGSKDADEEEGPFDILLAMEVGRGRAVFFGGATSFWNTIVLGEEENLDLLRNAVEWLGELGGPYKQYKIMNEEAQNVLSEAVSLYEDHQFPEAKTKFEEAVGAFEESKEAYPNAEADEGIEEAHGYLATCEIGIKADETFGNALDLFDSQEYERAVDEFEKAKVLYEEIEYRGRAKECTTKMEAVLLFQRGEDALSRAPSTFSTAGYEKAKSIFEQSKSKWEEYNDSDQVATCEEKITLCSNGIARIKRNRMMVIVGGVAAIVMVVVVVVVRKRRPKLAVVEVTPEIPPAEAPAKPGDIILEALKVQYAKGAITKEEYKQLKSIVEKPKPEEDIVMKALEKRYAQGKITKEEYEKLKSAVEKK